MSDEHALGVLSEHSDLSRPHTVRHYIYAPTSDAAVEIAEELESRGFEVERRLGADGTNWLVLASHRVVPSAELMADTRRSLEALADEAEGEYDGWEVEIGLN